MRRKLVVLFAVASSALLPASSGAQTTALGGGADANVDAERARVLFVRGRQLLEQDDFDGALAEFLASRRILATRGNTLNAAVCLRKLGRYDEALEMFEATRRFVTAEDDRRVVETQIAELSKLVGEVRLTISETDAVATIDGREMRADGSTRSARVRVGTHVLRVFKSGFAAYEASMSVAAGAAETRRVELKALGLSGTLAVTEFAGKNAEVVVDNIVVGKTPFQGAIAPGTHAVYLRGEGRLGSQPAMTTVRLNQVAPVVLALEELTAVAVIEPEPRDASVSVDGVELGQGGWRGRLRAGDHKVEVLARGYVPSVATVTFARDAERTVRVKLERDLSSDVWKSLIPNRFFTEASAFGLAGITLGGDPRSDCTGSCRLGVPLGFELIARFGYLMRTGLALALDVGYMQAGATTEARPIAVQIPGRGAVAATLDQETTAYMMPASVSLSYRGGDKWVYSARIGVGATVGSLRNARTATIGGAPTERVSALSSLAYLHVRPEARLGYMVHTNVELFAGAGLWAGVAVDRPNEDAPFTVRSGNEFAYLPAENGMGSFVLFARIGLGASVLF